MCRFLAILFAILSILLALANGQIVLEEAEVLDEPPLVGSSRMSNISIEYLPLYL
jgi:hypothetical protein